MRIGIYARVSTKDQSCELQVRDLRAYCAARGFDLVREYVDVGQSGTRMAEMLVTSSMLVARPSDLAFYFPVIREIEIPTERVVHNGSEDREGH
jgi:hypothetical protein